MIRHAIHHETPGKKYAEASTRMAFRAVIRRGEELLLIYSAKIGDYKFPGGGKEAGETEEEALRREVLEESGYQVEFVGAPLLRIEESREDKFSARCLFTMVSTYFECRVRETAQAQNLDRYEEDLGFEPRWIALDAALEANRNLLAEARGRLPLWIGREIWALETLKRLPVGAVTESDEVSASEAGEEPALS